MKPSSLESGAEEMHNENHPVYIDQRLKLETTFAGKQAEIADQFHRFRQEVAPKSHTKTWEKNILAENDTIQIISNWASFDVLQYQDKTTRAGMSMVHLLAIPREPIVNGVYLTAKNVNIIDDMIRLFEENWVKPQVRREILEHQIAAIERRARDTSGEPFSEQAHDAALAHFAKLEIMVEDLDVKKDFHYGLHLRPDNSADYLHLHIIAAPYEFRKYSTTEHDKKTKDAFEVRDFVVEDAQTTNALDVNKSYLLGETTRRTRVH